MDVPLPFRDLRIELPPVGPAALALLGLTGFH